MVSTASRNFCCNWRYDGLCSNMNQVTPRDFLELLSDGSPDGSMLIKIPVLDTTGQVSFGVTSHVFLNARPPRAFRRSFLKEFAINLIKNVPCFWSKTILTVSFAPLCCRTCASFHKPDSGFYAGLPTVSLLIANSYLLLIRFVGDYYRSLKIVDRLPYCPFHEMFVLFHRSEKWNKLLLDCGFFGGKWVCLGEVMDFSGNHQTHPMTCTLHIIV